MVGRYGVQWATEIAAEGTLALQNAPQMEFVVFTLIPIAVMVAMIVYCTLRVYRFNDRRPVLLIALLLLMTLHQSTEVVQFRAGTFYRTTSPQAEVFETGANLLASVGTYFVLQQITELRTARNELAATNRTLEERSSMVSVLHRILRHNVRNGLNVIISRAEFATSRLGDDEELETDLQAIQDSAWELVTISQLTLRVKQLLEETETEPTPQQLEPSLRTALRAVQRKHPDGRVSLEAADGVPTVELTATFPVAVADVVDQIIGHNDGDAHVTLDITAESDAGDEQWVVLRIDDDTGGLPEWDLRAIEEGEETPLHHAEGLALWILEWTVSQADGQLDVSTPETKIEVRLPAASNPPETATRSD